MRDGNAKPPPIPWCFRRASRARGRPAAPAARDALLSGRALRISVSLCLRD